MKKLLAILVALMMMLCGVSLAVEPTDRIVFTQPTDTDIPMQEAIDIATELFMIQAHAILPVEGSSDRYDFPILTLENQKLTTYAHFVTVADSYGTTQAWIINFFVKDTSTIVGGITLTSPDGAVVDLSFDQYGQIIETWEQTRGSQFFWTLEERMTFQQLYDPYAEQRNVMTSEQDISQEKALDIAIGAIVQKYSVSEDTLRGDYLYDYSLYTVQNGDAVDRIWNICLRQHDAHGDYYTLNYAVTILSTDGTVIDVNDNTEGWG